MAQKIGIGFKIGTLTVESDSGERKNGAAVWLCRCECGNTIKLDTRCLKRGTVTNCGCRKDLPSRAYDLTGKRFGSLVCLRPELSLPRKHGIQWECKCDCGNVCYAYTANLVDGTRTSCGCKKGSRPRVLIGKKFGELIVRAFVGKKDQRQLWLCECTCGNTVQADRFELENGQILDCGCQSAARTETAPAEKANGVHHNKKTGKWIAYMNYMGQYHYLGSYDSFEEAVKAREAGEDKYVTSFPKAVPRRVTLLRWDGDLENLPPWDGGWNYVDPKAKYMIVKASRTMLTKWMNGSTGLRFGVSEQGTGVKKLFRQAELALERCRKDDPLKYVYYDEENMDNSAAHIYQQLDSVCDLIEDMTTRYGAQCSKENAAQILNVDLATVDEMLNNGKLFAVGDKVDVQSICRNFVYREIQSYRKRHSRKAEKGNN